MLTPRSRFSFVVAQHAARYLDKAPTLASLSSRGRASCGRGICFFSLFLSLLGVSASAQDATKRPPIIGIASVSIVSPDFKGMEFYSNQLALGEGFGMCGGASCIVGFGVNAHQAIFVANQQGFDPLSWKPIDSNLVNVTFETTDIEGLRNYLKMRGLLPNDLFTDPTKGNARAFWLKDPEGHQIGFAQYSGEDKSGYKFRFKENQVSKRLIHAGFFVQDRAAEDHFFRDILGFRPYWHGGMKDDETNWVSIQVPDGTDWLEYMLYEPTGKDKHFKGVMNHIALGVTDIQAAKAQLIKNGWKPGEEPKIGRDGKWQLNVYDPDETRIEFMEFTPKEKPCCSEFTGPHPKP